MQRKLKARHLEMIAIGGTIGTGLLKKSGRTIASSGPLGALLVFAIVGLQVYGVATGIGEMVTFLPVAGAFSALPARFVNRPLGFATGWNYWLNWSLPGELAAIATLMTYWIPATTFPDWAWSIVFLTPMVIVNSISVAGYGEIEYVMCLVKVVVISLFLVVGTLVWFGVGSSTGPLWFKYWNPPIRGSSAADQFVSFAGAFTTAFYSYAGSELIGITSSEAANPRLSVPRAINGTFWRVLIFYIGSIFLVGVILSPDSTEILGKTIANSPFVYAYKQVGINAAAHVMNAVIILSATSAVNSSLYACSRSLYGLSQDGFAPAFFGRVDKRGVPYMGLYFSVFFAILGLIAGYAVGSEYVFNWLSGFVSINIMLAWMAMSFTHLRFRWGYLAQGRDLKDLPYVAPWFPYVDYLSLTIGFFVIGCITFGVFYQKVYNLEWYINSSWVYAGVPLYISVFVTSGIYYGRQKGDIWSGFALIPFAEMDFETDRLVEIETEEEKALAEAVHQKPKSTREWVAYIRYKLF
ncbi:amino acid permease/ SLC12A domain-containing protein [Chytriomyces cf. hyalinus JEL632]|nr:amino acid permease/ SLC12A domain-containing protein [Chytriomyces cf. hyalinus JEL632]